MNGDLDGVKTFIDTNILVYALDPAGSPKKCAACRKALSRLLDEGLGVVSAQVLSECFNVMTHKIGVDPVEARNMVLGFRDFELVEVSEEIFVRAVDTSILNKISIWDAQIAATAESAACRILLTEDLNNGQLYLGVKAVNPFHKN